ncbi:MAG TPA: hypothetical protein VGN22_21665 [Pseudonocardia sp.]
MQDQLVLQGGCRDRLRRDRAQPAGVASADRVTGRRPDDGIAGEQALAELISTEAGSSTLPATAERLGIGPAVVERVRADCDEHLHVPADPLMSTDDPALAAERGEHADDQRLRAALIAVERAAVVRLRDARKIDDIVLRRLRTGLVAEEVRWSALSPEPDRSPCPRGSAPP